MQPDIGPQVVRGEVVSGMPGRKELMLEGHAALAELGYDPDDLVDEYAEEQLRDAVPENTTDLLRWAYGFLIRYCGHTGRRHDPPTVGTIRQMIADSYRMTDAAGRGLGRYGRPYAPNTVATVIYCLSMIFDRVQWANPCRHPLVADQLKGYRNRYEKDGHRTDEADALTNEQSVLLARTQDLGTVQGLRNAAMLRGQFDLGCRADEWCKVRGEDISWLDNDRVIISFVRTKGRKKRKVAMQALPDVDGDVDPVRLLNAYTKARISGGWDGTGPLWVEVHRGDRHKDFETTHVLGGRFTDEPMKYGAYAAVFNRAVAKSAIDIDPVTKKKTWHFTTHSNRIGLIDGASRKGMRLEDIAPRTGHSPASPVIHKYLRERAQWGDANPGLLIRRAGTTEENA
jgi:integrase